MDKSTLFTYMPYYYRTSTIIDNLNNSNATELNNFYNKLESVFNQFFVSSADWALERWEKELGLKVDNSYNTEFRRSVILSKIRGQGTVTIDLIKNVSESFSNGEVDVIENNSEYSFTVKFIGIKGVPPNLSDLIQAIEEIKPAHLAVVFDFSWQNWNDIDSTNSTWNDIDALNVSWNEFEKGEWI